MYDPEAEGRVWKLVGGLKLWPRWYLKAFARLYADENPQEYERVRKRRYRKKLAKTDRPARLRAIRESATAELLTPQPSDSEPDS